MTSRRQVRAQRADVIAAKRSGPEEHDSDSEDAEAEPFDLWPQELADQQHEQESQR